jgi:immunity protein, SdpI family
MQDRATLASRRFLIVVAAAYVTSIAAYPNLPGPAPGVARPLIAFLLPTTAALTYLLVRRVWERDLIRDRDETFEPSYEAIVFAVVLFIVAIHLLVLAALTGALPTQRVWLMRATIVLVGLLVARVGNLLPRTRPNLALGIRTPRTLANRGLWMQTHRIAGYVAVALGMVFIVSGVFLSKRAIESVMGPAVLTAAALLLVSHYKYRRDARQS